MINIITRGVGDVRKAMASDARRMRFASFKALNQTAVTTKKALQSAMVRKFRSPTPFIKRSLRVQAVQLSELKSNKKMEVSVGFTDKFESLQFDPVYDVLKHHIEGGPRRPKLSEQRLRRERIIEGNEFLVPSRTAPLDKYGNIRLGLMTKIISDLRGFNEAGYTANRRRGRKAQYILGETPTVKGIFKVRGGSSKLKTGRWSLIMLIVKGAPRYKKRMDFYEIADKTFMKHYDPAFERWYAHALKKGVKV